MLNPAIFNLVQDFILNRKLKLNYDVTAWIIFLSYGAQFSKYFNRDFMRC